MQKTLQWCSKTDPYEYCSYGKLANGKRSGLPEQISSHWRAGLHLSAITFLSWDLNFFTKTLIIDDIFLALYLAFCLAV